MNELLQALMPTAVSALVNIVFSILVLAHLNPQRHWIRKSTVAFAGLIVPLHLGLLSKWSGLRFNLEVNLDPLPEVLLCLFFFGLFFVLFLQALALIHCSISFRILSHFLSASGRQLTLKGLEECYPFREVVSRKIRLMVDDGFAKPVSTSGTDWEDVTLEISPSGSRTARFCDWIRGLAGWGKGG